MLVHIKMFAKLNCDQLTVYCSSNVTDRSQISILVKINMLLTVIIKPECKII